MTNPYYGHDPDCDYWFDHYQSECSCTCPSQKPPAADMRAMMDEIAELKRRIEVLEARIIAVHASGGV